jgi:hypothetical protein
MKGISEYLSLTIALIITLILAARFTTMITGTAENIAKVVKNSSSRQCYMVKIVNTTKYVVINKSCTGRILVVNGEYKLVANTSDILVLETSLYERITIVTEGDLIRV